MEYLNNYKLYFKIISFSIVTNSIAHISPVDARCVCGSGLVSSRCLSGACVVLIKCARCAYLVRMWCLSSVRMVPAWCVCVVLVWLARGACLARA